MLRRTVLNKVFAVKLLGLIFLKIQRKFVRGTMVCVERTKVSTAPALRLPLFPSAVSHFGHNPAHRVDALQQMNLWPGLLVSLEV